MIHVVEHNFDIICGIKPRKVDTVVVSYKKLWKLLIDKEMNKTELRLATGASSATIARLTRNEVVSMDLLMRICDKLNCNIGDIMDISRDESQDLNER